MLLVSSIQFVKNMFTPEEEIVSQIHDFLHTC